MSIIKQPFRASSADKEQIMQPDSLEIWLSSNRVSPTVQCWAPWIWLSLARRTNWSQMCIQANQIREILQHWSTIDRRCASKQLKLVYYCSLVNQCVKPCSLSNYCSLRAHKCSLMEHSNYYSLGAHACSLMEQSKLGAASKQLSAFLQS